jgi:hypothetical protein
VQPPGDTGHELARGPAVQVGQRCREVKRDGTAGLVGCCVELPPKAASLQPARLAACLDRA